MRKRAFKLSDEPFKFAAKVIDPAIDDSLPEEEAAPTGKGRMETDTARVAGADDGDYPSGAMPDGGHAARKARNASDDKTAATDSDDVVSEIATPLGRAHRLAGRQDPALQREDPDGTVSEIDVFKFGTTPAGRQDTGGPKGKGDGKGDDSATYSDEAISELRYMIEEEKLAGDIYETFHDMYGLKVFKNIARSEDRHFNAVIKQADKIGIDTDEFLFEPSGGFLDAELQALYDTLLEAGSESLTAALEVGVAIESKDITDIAAAIEDVEGTRLAKVYGNLLTGSENHLSAFESLLV
ncbi:MAG: DUF2202 domain-containing protein [Antarcticimicrobium sp.]|uniref:DUF2202 domain-containing protein n=1 Tax=Antarcticimicrobium sp. TaxID=2824147 RepID=UPI002603B6E8|nr:DUF2202 domain-containing protein [Antarcticimicrobium sp.]MDF1718760.1 DUF2202 domain-containing protein [Antarcticimicrobium sp.]